MATFNLRLILSEHAAWIGTKGKQGKRAELYDANLSGYNFVWANLIGANLQGANLVGANLGNANLYGANLVDANLVDANLNGANLYRANLQGANLCNADLREANFYQARLCGAKLNGTILDTETYKTVTIPFAEEMRIEVDRLRKILDKHNMKLGGAILVCPK